MSSPILRTICRTLIAALLIILLCAVNYGLLVLVLSHPAALIAFFVGALFLFAYLAQAGQLL
jgi:hypothetical protein